MASLDDRARARLAQAARRGLARRPPPVRPLEGPRYELDGRPVVGFCSNDYLGYASEPARVTARRGASASRLVCGDHDTVRALEAAVARLAGSAAAVYYPSGYQANVAALSCLLEPDDRVFTDRLIHASLIDGVRLARARPTILPHGAPPPTPAPDDAPTFWITEAVFSMDGDRADPDALRAFAAAGGLVYLDEAHSAGLFAAGRGYAAEVGLDPAVRLFTFGKAFGHAGAAVLASEPVAELLRTTSRGFVFSTGPSPLLADALLETVERLAGPDGDRRRARLWDNVRRFGRHVGDPNPPSPIFPVVVETNERALAVASALLERGFHVQPIRPPTVPEGTARLRITVTAAHEPEQIDALADALHGVLRRCGIPLRVRRGIVPEPAP